LISSIKRIQYNSIKEAMQGGSFSAKPEKIEEKIKEVCSNQEKSAILYAVTKW